MVRAWRSLYNRRKEGAAMRSDRILITEDDMSRLRQLVRQGRMSARRDQAHLAGLDDELDRAEVVASGELSDDAALIGCCAGDVIEWATPGGGRRLRIEEVLFQPEAAAGRAAEAMR
jgi:hypothetical protein